MRWQLRPLGLGILLAVLGVALPHLHPRFDAFTHRAIVFSIAGACAVLSALLVWLLPPYVNLNINGCDQRFQHVGFIEHELELPAKTAKDEALVERPSPRYRLRIYYPAACAAGTKQTAHAGRLLAEQGDAAAPMVGRSVPLVRHSAVDEWQALSKITPAVPLPAFVYSHLGEMTIDAVKNAPRHADATNLPLVVFSHGLSAVPAFYWSLVSSLVRAGYVVAAPTHNDGSAGHLALDDGSKFPYETGEMIVMAAGWTAADAANARSHPTATQRPAMEATVNAHRCRQLRRRAMEVSYACSYVLDNPGPVSIDPSRGITFAGHSFGGATALLASELDERANCCVAYDPWLEATHPVPQKYQQAGLRRCRGLHFICSDWVGGKVDRNLSTMLSEKRLHPASERRVLAHTGHQSYTDFALLAPMVLRKLGMLGSADSKTTLRTVIAETLDFIQEATTA